MTEYQLEQKQAERRQYADAMAHASSEAANDQVMRDYEVDFFVGSFAEFRAEEQKRTAAGWGVAPYGIFADFTLMSCWFRRKRCPKCGTGLTNANRMILCPVCFGELMSR